MNNNFVVGDRIFIPSLNLKGTLRFLGKTRFKDGQWAGVELDMPLGKNDGSVQGVSYFTCEPNKGLFIHPNRLEKDGGEESKNNTGIKPPSSLSSGIKSLSGSRSSLVQPRKITPPTTTIPGTLRKTTPTSSANALNSTNSQPRTPTVNFDSPRAKTGIPTPQKTLTSLAQAAIKSKPQQKRLSKLLADDTKETPMKLNAIPASAAETVLQPPVSPVDRFQAQIEVLNSQNNLLSVELAQAKHQMETFQTQASMLHAQLLDAQNEKEKIIKEYAKLVEEVGVLRSETKELRNLEREIDFVQTRVDQLMRENENLMLENERVKAKEAEKPEKEDFEQQPTVSKEQAEELMKFYTDSQAVIVSLKGQLEVISNTVNDQTRLLSEKDFEIAKLQDSKQKLQEDLERLKEESGRKSREAEDGEQLKEQIESLRRENDRISQLNIESKKIIEKLESDKDQLKLGKDDEITRLKSELKTLHEENERVQNEISLVKQEKSGVDVEFEKILKDKSVSDQELHRLRDENERLQQEYSLVKDENSSIKNDYKIIMERLETFKCESEKATSNLKAEVETLRKQNEHLQNEQSISKQQELNILQKHKEQIETLKRENEQLRIEREKAMLDDESKVLISKLREENDNLKLQLKSELERLNEIKAENDQKLKLLDTDWKEKIKLIERENQEVKEKARKANEDNESLILTNRSIKDQLEGYLKVNEDLKHTVDEAKRESSLLVQDLEEIKSENATLKSQEQSLRATLNQLEMAKIQFEREFETLSQELERLKAENQERINFIQRESNELLNKQLADCEAKNKMELEAVCKDYEQKLEERKGQLGAIEEKSRQVADYERKIKDLENYQRENEIIIKQLQKTIEELQLEAETLVAERDAARTAISDQLKLNEAEITCMICDSIGNHQTEQCPVGIKWCENCETKDHSTEECTFAEETF